MAEIELRSLRVTADFDATKYTAGMQQKVAADQAGIASSTELGQAVTQQEAKISQASDVLGRLSRQYIDGYGSAQRFNAALNQLSSGIERGKISMEQATPILDGIFRKYQLMGDASQFAAKGQLELAAAITEANTKLRAQRGITPANQQITPANGNRRLSGGQIQGLGFQANDVITSALLGASPQQIAFQQGGQILQTLQMSEGGIVGSLAAIRGSLAAATTATIGFLGPIGLIATGFVAAGAAAVGFYELTRDRAKSTEEVLKGHKELIDEIAKSYPEATAAAKGYEDQVDKLPKSVIVADVFKQQSDEVKLLKADVDDLVSTLQQESYAVSSIGENAAYTFGLLADQLQRGEITVNQLSERLGNVRINPETPQNAKTFAEYLKEAVTQAAELETRIKGTAAAAANLTLPSLTQLNQFNQPPNFYPSGENILDPYAHGPRGGDGFVGTGYRVMTPSGVGVTTYGSTKGGFGDWGAYQNIGGVGVHSVGPGNAGDPNSIPGDLRNIGDATKAAGDQVSRTIQDLNRDTAGYFSGLNDSLGKVGRSVDTGTAEIRQLVQNGIPLDYASIEAAVRTGFISGRDDSLLGQKFTSTLTNVNNAPTIADLTGITAPRQSELLQQQIEELQIKADAVGALAADAFAQKIAQLKIDLIGVQKTENVTGIFAPKSAYAGTFADGGSFMVPGRSTQGDKTRIVLDANAGERVTVDRDGAGQRPIELHYHAAPGESPSTQRQNARQMLSYAQRELSRA